MSYRYINQTRSMLCAYTEELPHDLASMHAYTKYYRFEMPATLSEMPKGSSLPADAHCGLTLEIISVIVECLSLIHI